MPHRIVLHKIVSRALTAVFTAIIFCLLAISADAANLPFYIILGQSNAGWANRSSLTAQQLQTYGSPVPNTYIFNAGNGGYNAQYEPLQLGSNTRCENYFSLDAFGPETTLFLGLQSQQAKERLIYKQCQGGTSLGEDWNPNRNTGGYYGNRWFQFREWLRQAVIAATANGDTLHLEGVVWMQGEDDAKDRFDSNNNIIGNGGLSNSTNYQANLEAFFANFDYMWTSELNMPASSYKKVIGRIYAPSGYQYRDGVRAGQDAFCASSSNNAVCINTDTYTLQDWVHYDATSQLRFGTDIFDAAHFESGAPTRTAAKIKLFLQGAFNPSTGAMSNRMNLLGRLPLTSPYGTDFHGSAPGGVASVESEFFSTHPEIVDWIQVELRRTQDRQTLETRSVLLDSTGFLRDTNGSPHVTFDVSPGDYYLVVRHRNHLGVITSQPINMASSANPVLQDLTLAPDAFSAGCQNVGFGGAPSSSCVRSLAPGVYGMISGDINQDGVIQYASGPAAVGDQAYLLNTVLGGSIGTVKVRYSPGDLNMDGITKYNGPGNDQNFLLNVLLGGLTNAYIVGDPLAQ